MYTAFTWLVKKITNFKRRERERREGGREGGRKGGGRERKRKERRKRGKERQDTNNIKSWVVNTQI